MKIKNDENNNNLNSPSGVGGEFGVGIFIIADDITGAAEMAGVCLRYGLKVSFGIDVVPENEADVKIIATDSRSLSENDAYIIYQKIAEQIFEKPLTYVFKKCDSVLRGYVLTELEAVLSVKNFKQVLIQPANPATGRCIRNGVYYIDNERIQNTGFSKDPDFPANSSNVIDLLTIRSKSYHKHSNIFTGNIENISDTGVYMPDCESIADLTKSYKLADNQTLMCGSAAFFEQVLLSKGYHESQAEAIKFKTATDFLLVSGTTHPESILFNEKLAGSACSVISFPTDYLNPEIDQEAFEKWIIDIESDLEKNKKMVLYLSNSRIEFNQSSFILKQRLNKVISYLIENTDLKTLLIEGGATTYSLLKFLEWDTLIPVSELSPGVIQFSIPQHKNLDLIIKPGSYKWAEGLFDIN